MGGLQCKWRLRWQGWGKKNSARTGLQQTPTLDNVPLRTFWKNPWGLVVLWVFPLGITMSMKACVRQVHQSILFTWAHCSEWCNVGGKMGKFLPVAPQISFHFILCNFKEQAVAVKCSFTFPLQLILSLAKGCRKPHRVYDSSKLRAPSHGCHISCT